MECKKITVAEEGNKRGDKITQEEVKQCILDLKEWFEQKAPSIAKQIQESGKANENQIEKVENEIKCKLPEAIKDLLRVSNGQFQLHDSYKTLSVDQMIELNEVNAVSSFWKNGYVSFAQDLENNFLNANTETKEVVSWNNDQGVIESVKSNIDLYLEYLRNGVLKNQLEFIEEIGLVENQQ